MLRRPALLITLSSVILVVLSLGADSSSAATIRQTKSKNLVISSTDQVKDLYVSGNMVTVDSDVSGDLSIFGDTVIINGSVENSLFLAAGTVSVRGNVGRHVRMAGGAVTISGKIGGDLLVAGGTVHLTPEAEVGGDLYALSGSINLEGRVVGKTVISANSVSLNNEFGPTTVKSESIQLLSNVRIKGDFSYTSKNTAQIDSQAVIEGQTSHNLPSAIDRGFGAVLTLGYLLGLLGTFILAWFLLNLLPKTFARIAQISQSKVLELSVLGLGVAILIPLLLTVLLFSVIGSPSAILLGSIWLALVFAGSLIGKMLFGAVLMRLIKKAPITQLDWRDAALGISAIELLGLIPLFGGVLKFFVFLWGLGAISKFSRGLTDKKLSLDTN